MSRNFEQLTQSERRDAIAARRADAMSRHFELTMGQGSGPQHSTEFERPAYSGQALPRNFQAERADWRRALDILKKHWRLSVAVRRCRCWNRDGVHPDDEADV